LHDVAAIPLGQGDEVGAVEVDAVILDEIRVLTRVLAARAEPDLALLLIDAVDAPHHPLSLGKLGLHAPALGVEQVEVGPPVALRLVENLLGAVEVTEIRRAVAVHECLRPLVDQVPRLAGLRLDLDDAEPLVAAVGLLEREDPAALTPAQARDAAEVDPVHVGPRRGLRLDVEEPDLMDRDPVSR
jgi:hypothetical protein